MSKKAIPEATRRAVAERYGCRPGFSVEAKCHYCKAIGVITWHRLYSGKPSKWVTFSLELDHVIAESRGGSMDPDNFVLACRACNRSKGTRDAPARARAHVSLSEEEVSKA